MKIHTINPNGDVLTGDINHDGSMAAWRRVSALLSQKVGGPVELASVLFNGSPATLAVNEVGASIDAKINPGGQLPANARATAIYWTATIIGRTGAPFNPLTMPMIHGTAVLIERDKRTL